MKIRSRAKSILALLAAIAVPVAAMLYFKAAGNSAPTAGAITDELRVATTRFIGEAPTFIAYELGFFRDEGLGVTLTYSTAGQQSYEQLLRDEADVATVAELPVVYQAINPKHFSIDDPLPHVIVANMIFSNEIQGGLGNTNRGVVKVSDLAGKVVGLPRGTTVDFLFDNVLRWAQIDPANVVVRDLDVARLPEALANGSVDAIFAWDPHLARAKRMLGESASEIGGGQLYSTSWLVIFSERIASNKPDVITRYLRALLRAEQYLRENPRIAQEITARHLEMDLEVVRESWRKIAFHISLSQALLTTLEHQADWALQRRGLADDRLPDFESLIDPAYLAALKPEGISLIR